MCARYGGPHAEMEVGWRPYISRCLRLLCTEKREEKEACKRMEQKRGNWNRDQCWGHALCKKWGRRTRGGKGQQSTWKKEETRQERGWFRFLSCLPSAHLQKPGFFFSQSCSMKYTAKPILLLLSPFKPNNQEGKKIKKRRRALESRGCLRKKFSSVYFGPAVQLCSSTVHTA